MQLIILAGIGDILGATADFLTLISPRFCLGCFLPLIVMEVCLFVKGRKLARTKSREFASFNIMRNWQMAFSATICCFGAWWIWTCDISSGVAAANAAVTWALGLFGWESKTLMLFLLLSLAAAIYGTCSYYFIKKVPAFSTPFNIALCFMVGCYAMRVACVCVDDYLGEGFWPFIGKCVAWCYICCICFFGSMSSMTYLDSRCTVCLSHRVTHKILSTRFGEPYESMENFRRELGEKLGTTTRRKTTYYSDGSESTDTTTTTHYREYKYRDIVMKRNIYNTYECPTCLQIWEEQEGYEELSRRTECYEVGETTR